MERIQLSSKPKLSNSYRQAKSSGSIEFMYFYQSRFIGTDLIGTFNVLCPESPERILDLIKLELLMSSVQSHQSEGILDLILILQY